MFQWHFLMGNQIFQRRRHRRQQMEDYMSSDAHSSESTEEITEPGSDLASILSFLLQRYTFFMTSNISNSYWLFV